MPDAAPRTTADEIEVTAHAGLHEIACQDWDGCACPEAADGGRPFDPFTTHRFLRALETSGSVGTGTGWQPMPLVARRKGRVIAVAPLYAKSHSQGEYIFDHAFAQAYMRAGGRYYPKLQIAVPFTPATGRRFLCRPDEEHDGRAALAGAAMEIARRNGLSSAHVTFCTPTEAEAGAALGMRSRIGQQYHWHNAGYADFGDFLGRLSSRKRKAIRKERETAHAFGGEIHALTGTEITPRHWDAFWAFYQDTGARKWGTPYLTRAFFDQAQAELRDDILLVMAERGGRPVAAALNFIGRDTLYGRYWGCNEDHPCLHFELCYYQAIDWAITRGLSRVEAGAQGDHKLARGYVPVPVHSLHWFAEKGFDAAVARYLAEERDAVDDQISYLETFAPFRRDATSRTRMPENRE